MTIRLTTPELLNKVLDKLKQDPLYSEEANASFFKYCCDDIREGMANGTDEWYLDVDWLYDRRVGKIALIIRYHKRSDITTDKEYLNDDSSME